MGYGKKNVGFNYGHFSIFVRCYKLDDVKYIEFYLNDFATYFRISSEGNCSIHHESRNGREISAVFLARNDKYDTQYIKKSLAYTIKRYLKTKFAEAKASVSGEDRKNLEFLPHVRQMLELERGHSPYALHSFRALYDILDYVTFEDIWGMYDSFIDFNEQKINHKNADANDRNNRPIVNMSFIPNYIAFNDYSDNDRFVKLSCSINFDGLKTQRDIVYRAVFEIGHCTQNAWGNYSKFRKYFKNSWLHYVSDDFNAGFFRVVKLDYSSDTAADYNFERTFSNDFVRDNSRACLFFFESRT